MLQTADSKVGPKLTFESMGMDLSVILEVKKAKRRLDDPRECAVEDHAVGGKEEADATIGG